MSLTVSSPPRSAVQFSCEFIHQEVEVLCRKKNITFTVLQVTPGLSFPPNIDDLNKQIYNMKSYFPFFKKLYRALPLKSDTEKILAK